MGLHHESLGILSRAGLINPDADAAALSEHRAVNWTTEFLSEPLEQAKIRQQEVLATAPSEASYQLAQTYMQAEKLKPTPVAEWMMANFPREAGFQVSEIKKNRYSLLRFEYVFPGTGTSFLLIANSAQSTAEDRAADLKIDHWMIVDEQHQRAIDLLDYLSDSSITVRLLFTPGGKLQHSDRTQGSYREGDSRRITITTIQAFQRAPALLIHEVLWEMTVMLAHEVGHSFVEVRRIQREIQKKFAAPCYGISWLLSILADDVQAWRETRVLSKFKEMLLSEYDIASLVHSNLTERNADAFSYELMEKIETEYGFPAGGVFGRYYRLLRTSARRNSSAYLGQYAHVHE